MLVVGMIRRLLWVRQDDALIEARGFAFFVNFGLGILIHVFSLWINFGLAARTFEGRARDEGAAEQMFGLHPLWALRRVKRTE